MYTPEVQHACWVHSMPQVHSKLAQRACLMGNGPLHPHCLRCRLVLRCDGALLRRHVALMPERALKLLGTLLTGCRPNRCVQSMGAPLP